MGILKIFSYLYAHTGRCCAQILLIPKLSLFYLKLHTVFLHYISVKHLQKEIFGNAHASGNI